VQNLSGNCKAIGAKFSLVYHQVLSHLEIKPANSSACYFLLAGAGSGDLIDPGGLPTAGYKWKTIRNQDGNVVSADDVVIRGYAGFSKSISKDLGDVLVAKMIIKRKWRYNQRTGAVVEPNLKGFVNVASSYACPKFPESVYGANLPALPVGIDFKVNTVSADTWEVDMTSAIRGLIKDEHLYLTLLLYSGMETRPASCSTGSCLVANSESYDMTLQMTFAKNVRGPL
jgi:hypothetical protein